MSNSTIIEAGEHEVEIQVHHLTDKVRYNIVPEECGMKHRDDGSMVYELVVEEVPEIKMGDEDVMIYNVGDHWYIKHMVNGAVKEDKFGSPYTVIKFIEEKTKSANH